MTVISSGSNGSSGPSGGLGNNTSAGNSGNTTGHSFNHNEYARSAMNNSGSSSDTKKQDTSSDTSDYNGSDSNDSFTTSSDGASDSQNATNEQSSSDNEMERSRNSEPQDEQAAEDARSTANNAKNIRNAADVAIASKNPYAMAAGAAVKELDKATGGKSTEALGKMMTNANKTVPGGRKIQNLSNKASESGASDKIGKAAAMKNGMQGGGEGAAAAAGKGDVGEQRLQNSLANRNQNAQKAKSLSSQNSSGDNKPQENAGSGNTGGETEDEKTRKEWSFNSKENFMDTLFTAPLKIVKISIIASIVCFFLIIVFLAFLAGTIFNNGMSSREGLMYPVFNSKTYGTDDFMSIYEEGTSEYDYEVKYYKKLEEVSDNYAKDHGEQLNTNYIHAILIYTYFYDIDSENTSDTIVDYSKMYDMVDKIVELMTPSNSGRNIDYEINGEFYNRLKNSNDLKNYYKKVLKRKQMDEILTDAFEMASSLGDGKYVDDTVITEETTVTVVETAKDTGEKPKTKTLTVNNYLADSIYATTDSIQNSELVKAYTVAYSTNLVAKNKNLSVSESNIQGTNTLCDTSLGCSYDENDNLVSGSGEQSTKNTFFYNGGYYYKIPLSSSEINSLNNDINTVFGNVLVNSDGTYPVLDIGKMNGLGDGYKAILTSSYGDLKIKNIGENSYILDGSYGTKKVQTKVTFYDQNDYGDYNFCGKKKETIKTSGCGTTSMAIIVSTYENNSKYDPVLMMSEARKTGYCGGGISGTSPGFFKKEANTMKYKYYKASKYSKKDLNLVLQHLSQGDLVIVHIGPGHFTSGGHYMVLGGVDPETKKVYVYDPYNKVNKSYRKTGNGWYSFNDMIVKEAWNFYIIWKG